MNAEDVFFEYKACMKQKDFGQAYKHLRHAAEAYYIPALREMGLCYRYGIIVKRDMGKAKKWFERGDTAGDPYCGLKSHTTPLLIDNKTCTFTTSCNVLRRATTCVSYDKAIENIKEIAKDQQNPFCDEAKYVLFNVCDTKYGLPFLYEAAKNGHIPSMMRLAQINCEKGEEWLATKWCKKAYDTGCSRANDYLSSEYGVNPDWYRHWQVVEDAVMTFLAIRRFKKSEQVLCIPYDVWKLIAHWIWDLRDVNKSDWLLLVKDEPWHWDIWKEDIYKK